MTERGTVRILVLAGDEPGWYVSWITSTAYALDTRRNVSSRVQAREKEASLSEHRLRQRVVDRYV